MDVQQLAQNIQELIDNDELEEAHHQLEMIVEDGYIDQIKNLLEWAINNHNIGIAEILLDDIISPNIRLGGSYPLELAIWKRNLDMIRLLLDAGADLNLYVFLNTAVKLGNIDIVNELLRYGADPNKKDMFGESPLFSLQKTHVNRVEIAKRLIAAGADIDQRYPYDGKSLLHALVDDYDMVKFLLDLGMNPNDKDNDGRTPLMYAITWKVSPDTGIVRLLIDYGADPNIPNNNGETPLTILERGRYLSDNLKKILDIFNSYESSPDVKEPEFY